MTFDFVVHAGSDRATVNAIVDQAIKAASSRLGVEPERISCGDSPGALADAIASPSLFGGSRSVVVDLEGITDHEIDRIAAAASLAEATVIGYGSDVSAGVRKRLSVFATVTSHAIPRAKDAGEHIAALGSVFGLDLDRASIDELTRRCGHDLDRASSVLRALAAGGYHRPTPPQIRMLAGTSEADGVPWDVTDALEQGDLAAAMGASRRCEPIAVIAYLASKAVEAARVCEHPSTPASELLGVTPWQAKKAEGLARRLGSDGARVLVMALARADREVKLAGDRGHDVVDTVLAHWVRATHPTAAR